MKSVVCGVANAVCSMLRGLFGSSSGSVWLLAAAALFLIGAFANGAAGSRELTEIGVIGAVVAIAFVAAFMG
jgi:hypothetical protein